MVWRDFMKKINFLIKLKTEEKLSIIDPSDEIKESYIKKSENSLKSAIILLDNEQIDDSVSLTYYSMYNMLTALLRKTGIKCENHMGSIIILKELFNLDNSKILSAKTERVDKQYYIDFKATREQVEKMVGEAKEFNSLLYAFIEKTTAKEVSTYRNELNKSLNE